MSFTSKESRPDRFSASGSAAGAHPVLRVPRHGRLRAGHAAARVARDLFERQGPHRAAIVCCCGARFLSFPLPHIAILTGWFTAEVGRQPWTVYGVLRTADALTPFLTARAATISLVVFCAVYVFIFAFGVLYIYRLLRAGPTGSSGSAAGRRHPQSPDVRGRSRDLAGRAPLRRRRIAMIIFWVAVLAISTLLYVLLDGFDLGGRHPLRRSRSDVDRDGDDERDRADLGRQRDLARRHRRRALGCLPGRLCDASLRLLSAAASDARGADPARGRLRIPAQDRALALAVGRQLRRRIARRRLHAGADRRRSGRRGCRSPMAAISAATSAG